MDLIKNKENYETVLPEKPTPLITSRKFDFSELVYLCYGEKGRRLVLFFLTLTAIGQSTGYVAIFASSFASNIPLGFADA